MNYDTIYKTHYELAFCKIERLIVAFLQEGKLEHLRFGYCINQIKSDLGEFLRKYDFPNSDLKNLQSKFRKRYSIYQREFAESKMLNENLYKEFLGNRNRDSLLNSNYKAFVRRLALLDAGEEIDRILGVHSTDLARIYDREFIHELSLNNLPELVSKIAATHYPISERKITIVKAGDYNFELPDSEVALLRQKYTLNYFNVALNLANGEAYIKFKNYKDSHGTYTRICESLGIDPKLNNYMSSSINEAPGSDKNIFTKSKSDILKATLLYCQENGIVVCEEFLLRCLKVLENK